MHLPLGRVNSFQDLPPRGKPVIFRHVLAHIMRPRERASARPTPEQNASASFSLQLGPWASAGLGRANSIQDPPPARLTRDPSPVFRPNATRSPATRHPLPAPCARVCARVYACARVCYPVFP